jgi:UDP-3-O-[3-hydroxymyristoyl] glucosamine N-acyltransferase
VTWSVRSLAERLELTWRGDGERVLARAASLESADGESVGFAVPGTSAERIGATAAGALIVNEQEAGAAPCSVLLSDRPYVDYARASQLLHPLPAVEPGVAPGASVDAGATVAADAQVEPAAVVAADAVVEEGAVIGPGAVIGRGARVGRDVRIGARVVVAAGCELGARCIVQPGAVIGSDGFGFARDGAEWVRIPQVGRVVVGADVAIGANTTIDRGTADDTVIGDGVILDNLIQIAHNVRIGENTAMAGCVGVAGSARIGARCLIGGAAGILGHLEIVDDVQIAAMSLVRRSIREPGSYSAGTPLEPSADWRRNAARFRQLDRLARRVAALEKDRDGS